jgi:hypothetical protein
MCYCTWAKIVQKSLHKMHVFENCPIGIEYNKKGKTMKLLKPSKKTLNKVPHAVIETAAGKIVVLLAAPNTEVANAWDSLEKTVKDIEDGDMPQIEQWMLLKSLRLAQLRFFELYFLAGSLAVDDYPEDFTEEEEDRWDDLGRLNNKRYTKLHLYQQDDLYDKWQEWVDWFYTSLNRWN